MRSLRPVLLLCLLLVAGAAYAADPSDETEQPSGEELDRLRFGISAAFSPKLLGSRFDLGLGWTLPQRWYDADGELLTERSLLNPGDDLERSGFYLALRF
jgi:hypothetical protein